MHCHTKHKLQLKTFTGMNTFSKPCTVKSIKWLFSFKKKFQCVFGHWFQLTFVLCFWFLIVVIVKLKSQTFDGVVPQITTESNPCSLLTEEKQALQMPWAVSWEFWWETKTEVCAKCRPKAMVTTSRWLAAASCRFKPNWTKHRQSRQTNWISFRPFCTWFEPVRWVLRPRAWGPTWGPRVWRPMFWCTRWQHRFDSDSVDPLDPFGPICVPIWTWVLRLIGSNQIFIWTLRPWDLNSCLLAKTWVWEGSKSPTCWSEFTLPSNCLSTSVSIWRCEVIWVANHIDWSVLVMLEIAISSTCKCDIRGCFPSGGHTTRRPF